MKKVAVITSIFGGFDIPKPMVPQSYQHDYFCFTENSGFPFRQELHNRIRAKWFKYQQHQIEQLQAYEIIIWLDGSFHIKSENFVEYMVRQLGDYDIAITKHNKRNCLYDEGKYIIESIDKYILDRYGHEKELMTRQLEDYRRAGMPEQWGLFNCGLFARTNTEDVNRVMDLIWIDNIRYASQDQNPFPFYCWKHGMNINRLSIDICRNHFWELKSHPSG